MIELTLTHCAVYITACWTACSYSIHAYRSSLLCVLDAAHAGSVCSTLDAGPTLTYRRSGVHDMASGHSIACLTDL